MTKDEAIHKIIGMNIYEKQVLNRVCIKKGIGKVDAVRRYYSKIVEYAKKNHI